jgi:hypothetical protein
MMQAMIGPGLDAELAYRRESVLRSAGHRGTRRGNATRTSETRTNETQTNERPAARTQPVRPRQAA